MYASKEDEGEERRKRKMEWVGSCSERTVCPTANERPGSLRRAPDEEVERVDTVAWGRKQRSRMALPSGFVFVERTKTWTMMPPHIHETNQYLKSQTSCHTDHTHVLK
jgi:hypothetical protein